MKKTLLVILLLSTAVYAGRPLKSADALFVGRKAFQVEFASDAYHNSGSYLFSLPTAFTYGLSDKTDLQTGFAFAPAGPYFIEALNAGIKQNIFSAGNAQFAVQSGISSAFDNGLLLTPSAFFSFVSSVSFNNLTVHGNAGYNRNSTGGEFMDIWFTSVAAEYSLSGTVTLAADFLLSRNPLPGSYYADISSVAGVSVMLMENLSIDTGLNFCHRRNNIDFITSGVTLQL